VRISCLWCAVAVKSTVAHGGFGLAGREPRPARVFSSRIAVPRHFPGGPRFASDSPVHGTDDRRDAGIGPVARPGRGLLRHRLQSPSTDADESLQRSLGDLRMGSRNPPMTMGADRGLPGGAGSMGSNRAGAARGERPVDGSFGPSILTTQLAPSTGDSPIFSK